MYKLEKENLFRNFYLSGNTYLYKKLLFQLKVFNNYKIKFILLENKIYFFRNFDIILTKITHFITFLQITNIL